jgi:hypothetical protein
VKQSSTDINSVSALTAFHIFFGTYSIMKTGHQFKQSSTDINPDSSSTGFNINHQFKQLVQPVNPHCQ